MNNLREVFESLPKDKPINISELNIQDKLINLISILDSFPTNILDEVLSLTKSSYTSYLDRTDLQNFDIDFRLSAVFNGIGKLYREVTGELNISITSLYKWRVDVCTILYFILQNYLSINIGEDIELHENKIYSQLLRYYNEKQKLQLMLNNEVVQKKITEIPYLEDLVSTYLKENSIDSCIIELNLVATSDPEYNKKLDYYNLMFREFFFNASDSSGFYKMFRTISWAKRIKIVEFGVHIESLLLNFYSLDVKLLDKNTKRKYYLIRNILEWIIRIEYELYSKLPTRNTFEADLFNIQNGNKVIDYKFFLERTYAYKLLPKFLIELFKEVASNRNAQFDMAEKLDIPSDHANKVKAVGYFFSLLENYLIHEDVPITERVLIKHLKTDRNHYLNELRLLIKNLNL